MRQQIKCAKCRSLNTKNWIEVTDCFGATEAPCRSSLFGFRQETQDPSLFGKKQRNHHQDTKAPRSICQPLARLVSWCLGGELFWLRVCCFAQLNRVDFSRECQPGMQNRKSG